MGWTRMALLGLGAHLASAWVTLPDAYTDRKIAWPMPTEPLSDTGLGGGLAFAIDPQMCDRLLPQFKEDDNLQVSVIRFVTCEDINDAIERAMTTWSNNHPYIKFYNVSDECAALGEGVACDLAELWIDAKPPASGNELVAAFVLHNPEGVGRNYKPGKTWDTGVRYPSGEVSNDDWAIEFTTLTFHTHMCWYLDATFCSQFRLLNDNFDVNLMMQFVIWGIWSISFLLLFLRLAQIFFFVFRFGFKVGLRRAIRAQSQSMVVTYVLLFFLISPPIIWFKIFVPCVTCYDFEATAAHEIGHVLGFTHTDSFPNQHKVATKPFSKATCELRDGIPGKSGSAVELDPNDPLIEESIMFHLTTRKSKTCLTTNDFQGLLYQYPVCDDDLILTEAVCVKQERNVGWLRFVTATLPPFVFASVAFYCLVELALYYENKEQTKNRWKLGGIAAVQEGRRRKAATKEDKKYASGIFGKGISKSISRARSMSKDLGRRGSKAPKPRPAQSAQPSGSVAAQPSGTSRPADNGVAL